MWSGLQLGPGAPERPVIQFLRDLVVLGRYALAQGASLGALLQLQLRAVGMEEWLCRQADDCSTLDLRESGRAGGINWTCTEWDSWILLQCGTQDRVEGWTMPGFNCEARI